MKRGDKRHGVKYGQEEARKAFWEVGLIMLTPHISTRHLTQCRCAEPRCGALVSRRLQDVLGCRRLGCPDCKWRKEGRDTIAKYRIEARKIGVELVSSAFPKDWRKAYNMCLLLWRYPCGCIKERRFTHVSAEIRMGRIYPCKKCGDSQVRVDNFRRLASICAERGYQLLSTLDEYTDQYSKMRAVCPKGHPTTVSLEKMHAGRYCCRKCMPLRIGSALRLPGEVFHELAKARGYTPLFEAADYKNKEIRYPLACGICRGGDGRPYVFDISYGHLREGSGCPLCSETRGQRVAHVIMEALTGKRFRANQTAVNNPRLRWLKEVGRRHSMELDGFCGGINAAFEHQGRHHEEVVGDYKMTQEDLSEVRRKDQLKKALCTEHGIKLVVIPEIPRRLSLRRAGRMIKQLCIRAGIPVLQGVDPDRIDLKRAYMSRPLVRGVTELLDCQSLPHGAPPPFHDCPHPHADGGTSIKTRRRAY